MRINSRNEGFSLLEVLVAIVVVSLIGMAALALLNARSARLEDNNTVQEARTSAEEALSALSAVARTLPEGGSFDTLADNNLRLSPCQPENCDLVLTPDAPASARTSPGQGFPYSANPPAGHDIAFVRRWRVDAVNSDFRLRKITVAVLKNEQSAEAVVLEETVVTLSR